MKYPNFGLEKKLIQQGYHNIVGIDEVGRGAWAGPLVAVATRIFKSQFLGLKSPRQSSARSSGRRLPISKQILKLKLQNPKLIIKDSKLLSEKIREVIFEKLSKKVIWSVGIVGHQEIDKCGLTWANLTVIKRALKKLEIEPDYLLLDKVSGFRHKLPFQSIVDGDRKVMSITIASILAKVTRDRLMRKYHQKFPHYYFHQHKGYGTPLHQRCLEEYGICEIHRKSYTPIRQLLGRRT